MRVLVTGGAGFIGSAVVRQYLSETDVSVINVDKLTYAANLGALEGLDTRCANRYVLEQIDICDGTALKRVFERHRPEAVMHLAAESHVDRSIDGPGEFVRTNVVGTQILLDTARWYWSDLDAAEKNRFRFHHISTDEVFGSLGPDGVFTEESPYAPNSPYSASKAAADHFVRAWHETYGLPVVLTNCSNNYGPHQFPEKLIPLMISKALAGDSLPVYGDGQNVRDWLHVEDHARALRLVLEKGKIGETYTIGGSAERTNLQVVEAICDVLNECQPCVQSDFRDQITFVTDRPGHDFRYAVESSKIEQELGWKPRETFETGLRKTILWYLGTGAWQTEPDIYAGERLGLTRGAL